MGYTDKERAAAYAREWRAKHADKVHADDSERRARERVKDPSAATQKMREWRAANPEKAKTQAKRGSAQYKLRLETDPVFREHERIRRENYMSIPGVRERRRKQWREWIAIERKKDPTLDRRRALKSIYGLTPEQYEAMALAQEGKCAICGSSKPGGRHGKNMHVDHCHNSDRVRGLLCHGCNTGLGSFKDDTERLRLAIAYLEKHR